MSAWVGPDILDGLLLVRRARGPRRPAPPKGRTPAKRMIASVGPDILDGLLLVYAELAVRDVPRHPRAGLQQSE